MNDYVKILKEFCSEEELLRACDCTPLKKGYIRLSAMFDLMNGMKKEIVMKTSKISIRTLQFWIQRFTERGFMHYSIFQKSLRICKEISKMK